MPPDVVRFTGEEGRETTKGFVDARDMLLSPEIRDGVKGVFTSERVRWRRDGVFGWLNIVNVNEFQGYKHRKRH
jgi:hypothetical protein